MQLFRDRFASWQETQVGVSEEGRPIIAFHNGSLEDTQVLAWSLMHGNETTGAEALLAMPVQLQVNWCMIPIVNPDGAERFSRVNAKGVDVNRDARALESAEAKALHWAFEQTQPELALNLHDQRTCFRPEGVGLPATFSLLAPRSSEKGGCPNEIKAAACCSWVAQFLADSFENYALARFDNAFYPTAFGDLFQEKVPTITLETGIALGDWNREGVATVLRDVLSALDEDYGQNGNLPQAVDAYYQLPMNVNDAVDVCWESEEGHACYKLEQSLIDGELTREPVKVNNPCGICWLTLSNDSSQYSSINQVNWEEYL